MATAGIVIPTPAGELERLEKCLTEMTWEIAVAEGQKDTNRVIRMCEQRADCRKQISKLRSLMDQIRCVSESSNQLDK